MRDAQRQDAQQGIRRPFICQDAAGVVIEKNSLVFQGSECIIAPVDGLVVGGQVAGGEARCDTQGSAKLEGQRGGFTQARRRAGYCGVDFVPVTGRQIKADVA